MGRICVSLLVVVAVVVIASVAESPAIPALDDCTMAQIAYCHALYEYHQCASSFGGLLNPSSCDGFLAIVNATRAAFASQCHVTVEI
jgi:hypothetical protein